VSWPLKTRRARPIEVATTFSADRHVPSRALLPARIAATPTPRAVPARRRLRVDPGRRPLRPARGGRSMSQHDQDAAGPPDQAMDRIWIRNRLDSAGEATAFKDLRTRLLRVGLGTAEP